MSGATGEAAAGEAAARDVAEAAEEVRAWLVQLRGGAPFLSSADGELLAGWLEGGVPVVTILRGIEAVAERRRAKRTRTPFSLRSCKTTVEKLAARTPSWRLPVDLPAALAPAPGSGPDPRVDAVLAAIGALSGPAPDRAHAACGILRAFHAAVWDGLPDAERAELLASAAEELAPLREMLGEEAFRIACEEQARDRVRARYPTLSATRIWEEFGLGLA